MWTGWGWGPASALASRFPACAWPAWHCHGIIIILIIIMSIQILVIIIRMMKILEFRKSGKELAQCSAVWLCWWTDNTVGQIIQSLSCWGFHCTSSALVLSTQCTSGALQRSQKSLATFGQTLASPQCWPHGNQTTYTRQYLSSLCQYLRDRCWAKYCWDTKL